MRLTDTRPGCTTPLRRRATGGACGHARGGDGNLAFRHQHVDLLRIAQPHAECGAHGAHAAFAADTVNGRVRVVRNLEPAFTALQPHLAFVRRERTRTSLFVFRSMTLPSSSTMREKPPMRVS